MMVLVGQGSFVLRALAENHPGRIGQLYGPSYWRPPKMPYALDNDAFAAWKERKPWNESAWLRMLEKAKDTGSDPLWCLVPDVVANREKTLEKWHCYHRVVWSYGWDCAFAVQDGMTTIDVPVGADVVFVGGTTRWKWNTLPMWCKSFQRVHVGRCPQGKLLRCEELGAESCDSSGWFRDTQNGKRVQYLKAWLLGQIKPHPEFEPLVR